MIKIKSLHRVALAGIALLLVSFSMTGMVAGKAQAQIVPQVAEETQSDADTQAYVPDEVIVKYKSSVSASIQGQMNMSLGAQVIHTSQLGGFKVVRIPQDKTVAEVVNSYRQNSNVEYAEPNYLTHISWTPNDYSETNQWHFADAQINLRAAWDLDTTAPNYGGDSSIVVAVVDSGVAYENYGTYVQVPDLANANFWVNTDETAGDGDDDDGNGKVDDRNGWDFVNSDAHPNDDNAHGTHVTGTIAQSTNNTGANTILCGIAFNTTIMPLKVFDADGNGNTTNTANAFYYAVANGAKIINYSGGGTSDTATMEDAAAYAADHGVLVIAAAGNVGDIGNATNYPAAYNDSTIAVSATKYDKALAYYSNYGSHIDIAAPGGQIYTARGSGVMNDQSGDGNYDGVLQQTITSGNPASYNYYFMDGTSMATPHVTGVAALLLAKNPTWTPAQLRWALESKATDIGSAGRDNSFGWGLLNAGNTVGASLPPVTSCSDAGLTTPSDDFDDFATEHTVYLGVTGLLPTTSLSYKVAYYDGSNTKRATDTQTSSAGGALSSQHTFAAGTDQAGGWHAVVCSSSFTPPDTYSSTWAYMITQDTFNVDGTAVPEFPVVITAIIVPLMAAALYFWMRRRAAVVRV